MENETASHPEGASGEQPEFEQQARFAEREFNVRDYGAVGDGQTDDTVAIQTAIDDATDGYATVYIPDGRYRLSDPLFVGSQTRLRGSGTEHSVLERTDGHLMYVTGAHEVQVVELTLTGSYPNDPWSTGIVASGADDLKVQGCRFQDLHAGVYLENARGIQITDCVFETIGASGVRLGYGGENTANEYIYVQRNTFQHVNHAALDGNSAIHAHGHPDARNEHVWIEDNHVLSGGIGIGLDNIDYASVSRNRIVGNDVRGECIAIIGSNNQILDNEVSNSIAAGILIWGVAYREIANNVVRGNTCYDNAQGIAIVCGQDHTIIDGLLIEENRCYATSPESRQAFGIQSYINGTVNFEWRDVYVVANDLRGNAVSAYNFYPPRDVVMLDNLI